MVAAITASSPVQLATLRPGAFAPIPPRAVTAAVTRAEVTSLGRVRVLAQTRDGGAAPLARAASLIAVGAGVPPDQYGELDELRALLGAELVGTRKVTDRGWLPRSRQVGLTGHSLGPRLYIAVGVSGKFNHLIGARRAGTILAINSDPSAPVFDGADIGIIGDWREAVLLLTVAIAAWTAPVS